MLNSLKSLLRHFALPDRRALELAYLEAATNRYDLERRERDIEAGLFSTARSSY